MDHIKNRWADTQLADDNVTSYVWKPLPKGCDYQGRYPEAAHAACELDDDNDERPIPGAGLVLWLALSLIFFAGLVAVFA